MDEHQPVLLYDGICHLCNGLVRFVIRWDRKKTIRFASLQSDRGQSFLKDREMPTDDFDTLVYIKEGKYYVRSTAVLEVLKDMGGFWRVVYILIILPICLRDPVYRLVARLRYRLFGKSDQCTIPAPEIRERFLDV